MECDRDIYTIFDVELGKRHGNNTYQLIGVTKHYKKGVDRNDPLNMPHWEFLEFL